MGKVGRIISTVLLGIIFFLWFLPVNSFSDDLDYELMKISYSEKHFEAQKTLYEEASPSTYQLMFGGEKFYQVDFSNDVTYELRVDYDEHIIKGLKWVFFFHLITYALLAATLVVDSKKVNRLSLACLIITTVLYFALISTNLDALVNSYAKITVDSLSKYVTYGFGFIGPVILYVASILLFIIDFDD